MGGKPRRSKFDKVIIAQRAGAIFWQKGYEATRMSDIARTCGCEPSTLYNYFQSKEHLLYEVMRGEMEQTVALAKAVQESHNNKPSARLQLLIKNHISFVAGDRRSSRLLFDSELRSLSPAHRRKIIELRDGYEQIVREIICAGTQCDEFAKVDNIVIGFAIIAMIVRTRIWFSPNGRLSPEEIAEMLVQFILHGLQYKCKENEQVYLSDRNVDMDAMLRETNSIQDGRRKELL